MLFEGSAAVYSTAVTLGMLHGVEPGHGWPVAAVFALRRRQRWWYGIWAAVILAVAHLTSSFAVVAVYALANRRWKLDSFGWMNVVAGGLLIAMAVHQWRSGHHHARGHSHAHKQAKEHGHEHVHDDDHAHSNDHGHSREVGGGRSHGAGSPRSLWGLVGFAFALGFVHEEEFAIIALAVGKVSAWLVMAAYASAVGLSLVLLTSVAIATLNRFESKLDRYEHVLPKVSAGILGLMGFAYVFRLL